MTVEITYWVPDQPTAPPPDPAALADPRLELEVTDRLMMIVSESARWFRCPRCSHPVPTAWVMEQAGEVHDGSPLERSLPCGHDASLNELDADAPYGFSRWAVRAEDVAGEQGAILADLRRRLGVPLRTIVCRA